jgi:hypothetical protein
MHLSNYKNKSLTVLMSLGIIKAVHPLSKTIPLAAALISLGVFTAAAGTSETIYPSFPPNIPPSGPNPIYYKYEWFVQEGGDSTTSGAYAWFRALTTENSTAGSTVTKDRGFYMSDYMMVNLCLGKVFPYHYQEGYNALVTPNYSETFPVEYQPGEIYDPNSEDMELAIANLFAAGAIVTDHYADPNGLWTVDYSHPASYPFLYFLNAGPYQCDNFSGSVSVQGQGAYYGLVVTKAPGVIIRSGAGGVPVSGTTGPEWVPWSVPGVNYSVTGGSQVSVQKIQDGFEKTYPYNTTQHGTYKITRTGGSLDNSLKVNYSFPGNSGSASLGTDFYPYGGSATSTSVTIPANQSYVYVTIYVIQDSYTESAESVNLTISPALYYTVGTASALMTIKDNNWQ